MDHRIPPVWCHLMSLDFRLSLKFDHLINIITIARENGKNMKSKTLLKWIIMDKNSFTVHANCSNYDDQVWKALGRNWCSVPFSVSVIGHFESFCGLPLYVQSQTCRSWYFPLKMYLTIPPLNITTASKWPRSSVFLLLSLTCDPNLIVQIQFSSRCRKFTLRHSWK